jgi:hypothetical protein
LFKFSTMYCIEKSLIPLKLMLKYFPVMPKCFIGRGTTYLRFLVIWHQRIVCYCCGKMRVLLNHLPLYSKRKGITAWGTSVQESSCNLTEIGNENMKRHCAVVSASLIKFLILSTYWRVSQVLLYRVGNYGDTCINVC